MKLKRLFVFLLSLIMLFSIIPAVYAAEIPDGDSVEETGENITSTEEQPQDGLNPVLVEAGFTSDQLSASTVRLENISTFAAATRSVKKTATLRNCDWMDFMCTDNSRQGFHYADEDNEAPWDYMNMIYCLENKKDFSIGSGHTGIDEIPLDGSGSSHGESVWYGFSADQRTAIALVLLYGAPTKLWDDSWGINPAKEWNKNNPNIGYRFATQAIIWELAQGLREPTPPYKLNSTYWLDKSKGVCTTADGSVDHFLVAYNSIISDLQTHNTIPSFAGDFAATAPEIQLSGNSTSVTDSNKVLDRFTFSNTSAVTYSKNGNTLTINTSGAIPTDVQSATATLPDAASSLYEVWYNQYDKSKQVCIKVSIPASDPVPAYFKLKASTGSLSLKKTTEDGKNVAGWKFNIYSDQGCTNLISGTHTTDANGNISVPGLPAGQVWVKEIGHTDSNINTLYACGSTNPQAVTITAGQTASFSFYNKLNLGKAQIIKTATNGGSVAGWHFTIKDSAGNAKGSYVTDASGVITVDLLPGTYTVTETDGAYKYWVNDLQPTKTVTVKANETAKVTFVNQYRGQAQIVKTATNGGSVAGWHFTVKDSSGAKVGDYVTDATGIITLDLEPGSYTVTETDGTYPYWHNDPKPTKTVTVKAGETASVTFLNEWVGKAKIIKTLANPEAGTVKGWQFSISKVDGTNTTYLTTVTTGADGTIVYDLEPGKYLITELIEENSLWECITDQSVTITVKAGETAEVSFTNALRPGKISVRKVNTQGESLDGVEFLLEWSEDGENWTPVSYTDSAVPQIGGCTSDVLNGKLITDEAGLVTFEGLYPTLQYRLTETATKNGYQLLKEYAYVGTLEVEQELEVVLTVVNVEAFVLPQTGSKTLALMPIGLLLCAAVCMGALFVLKKKEA